MFIRGRLSRNASTSRSKAILFVLAVGSMPVASAQVQLPHTFVPGEPATAQAVNENFDALVTAIEGFDTAGSGIASGVGAPALDFGNNGDFYWDTLTKALYGPKTAEGWGSPARVGHSVGINGANTAVGDSALAALTTGAGNVAVGLSALAGIVGGNNNQAVGNSALMNNVADENIAIGSSSMMNNTNGFRNVAIGFTAMTQNINGFENVAVGSSAMALNKAGGANTALGYFALHKNVDAGRNTALGYQAMVENTSGYQNTAVGYAALIKNVAGFNNTAVGFQAGPQEGLTALTNTLALGAGARVTESNTVQIGNQDIQKITSSGALTLGAVTYPNFDGSAGQVLSTDGTGMIAWVEPARSSYQIWLDSGNSGTEAEFLGSLQGEPGLPGPPGPAGVGDLGCSTDQIIRWNSDSGTWLCTDFQTLTNAVRGTDIDCASDPAALVNHLATSNFARGTSHVYNISGRCELGQSRWELRGAGDVIIQGQTTDAALAGSEPLKALEGVTLTLRDLRIDAESEALLVSDNATAQVERAVFNVNNGVFAVRIRSSSSASMSDITVESGDFQVDGNSWASVNNFVSNGPVGAEKGSQLLMFGQVQLQESLGAYRGATVALSAEPGEVTASFQLDGGCNITENSTLSITGSVESAGTCFISNNSHVGVFGGSLTFNYTSKTDGLGRAFNLEGGVTAQFWDAALITQGFPPDSQEIVVDKGSYLELRGTSDVPSSFGATRVEDSSAELGKVNIGSLYVTRGTFRAFDSNFLGSVSVVDGAGAIFSSSFEPDISIQYVRSSGSIDDVIAKTGTGSPASISVRNSRLVVGSTQTPALAPALSSFNCQGMSTLEHPEFPANGLPPQGCMSTSFWNQLISGQNF